MFTSAAFVLFFCSLSCLCWKVDASEDSSWTYSGQESWSSLFPNCGQSGRQSPIRLPNVSSTSFVLLNLFKSSSLSFENYNVPQSVLLVSSEEKEFSMQISNKGGPIARIREGGLPGTFVLNKIAFHWGPTDQIGSEHTIDLKPFAGEIQLVHYNEKYKNYETALSAEDGLAILSSLMETSDDAEYSWMNEFSISLQKYLVARSNQSEAQLDVPPLTPKILLPKNVEDFLRYNGSMTTPPCLANTIWTVFNTPLAVPRIFLKGLRAFSSTSGHGRKLQSNSQAKIFVRNQDIVSYDYDPNKNEGTPPDVSNFRPLTVITSDFSPLHEGSFCYNKELCQVHPEEWKRKYPACGGPSQSPIDLRIEEAEESKAVSFEYRLLSDSKHSLPIFTDNFSLQVHFPNVGPIWELRHPEMRNTYILSRIIIHWSPHVSGGSEHSIETQKYPIELQLVHYRSDLKNLSNALTKVKGVVVVAKMFKISEAANADSLAARAFEKIFFPLEEVWKAALSKNSKFELSAFNGEVAVGWSLNPAHLLLNDSSFFIYEGSLTFPPCTPGIKWIVMEKPSALSQSQWLVLKEFLTWTNYSFANNARHLQSSQSRSVVFKHVVGVWTPVGNSALESTALAATPDRTSELFAFSIICFFTNFDFSLISNYYF